MDNTTETTKTNEKSTETSVFNRSQKITRSPTEKSMTHASSLVDLRTMDIEENRENGETNPSPRTQRQTIKKTIDELLAYVKVRHNVHHEIKRLVLKIKNSYDDLESELKEAVLKDLANTDDMSKEKTSASSQTTLQKFTSKSSQTNGEVTREKPKTKRRLETDLPTGRSPKQKKQKRPDELQESESNDIVSPMPSIDMDPSIPNEKNQEWTLVDKQKQRKTYRKRPPRPDALLIKNSNELLTYADILRQVKSDPKLSKFGPNVSHIRKTAKGELLFELIKTDGCSTNTLDFQNEIKMALGANIEVKSFTDETIIECKDLDEITTAQDVWQALTAKFEEMQGLDVSSIKSLKKAYGNTQTAVISVPTSISAKILATEKIRIGWVNCRLRERLTPKQCFKCLEFGHLSWKCSSPIDRSKLCWRCGKPDHKSKDCKNDPSCFACTNKKRNDTNHGYGSYRCPEYKEAIKTVRSESQQQKC